MSLLVGRGAAQIVRRRGGGKRRHVRASRPASCSPSSARTAPASRRSSTWWAASCSPTAAASLLAGQDITGLAPRRIWRLGVGRTFQVAQTFVSMTVAENVQMALISRHGRTRAWWPDASGLYRDEAMALLDRVGIGGRRRPALSELAYGDVKRVELAIALAGAPKLLLMDEPTAGMAPKERAQLMQLDARHRPRARHRRAVHRARHGRRVRPRRRHHRAGARRDHRRAAGPTRCAPTPACARSIWAAAAVRRLQRAAG